MQETLRGAVGSGLERSCDWIRAGAGAPGLERAEAYFSEQAFELHRHDTYAVGITCSGVQAFRYRGARRIALPGQVHVLHPDELHDGGPATAEGFRYRIVYVEPELIRRALDGAPLPFVADPVRDPAPATAEIARLLADIDEPISELASAEIAASIADALQALGGPGRRLGADSAARCRARERAPGGSRERADAGCRARAARRPRPLFDRPPFPPSLRDEP